MFTLIIRCKRLLYTLSTIVSDFIYFFSDHYFTSVSWSKSDGIAVIWMNRAQNLSIVTYCAPPSFLCKEVSKNATRNVENIYA